MADYYRRTTSNDGYYSGSTTGSEPDMRRELANMFDGVDPEVPKAEVGLYRTMRRDADGNPTPCACVDIITKEPDKDRWCPFCWGEGYLWDEDEIQFYSVQIGLTVRNASKEHISEPGLINSPLVVFYIRYNVVIEFPYIDKIIRLNNDVDGNPANPRKRKDIYRITAASPLRCDNGRLEYWKVFTYRDKVKYLNPPSYTGV